MQFSILVSNLIHLRFFLLELFYVKGCISALHLSKALITSTGFAGNFSIVSFNLLNSLNVILVIINLTLIHIYSSLKRLHDQTKDV